MERTMRTEERRDGENHEKEQINSFNSNCVKVTSIISITSCCEYD